MPRLGGRSTTANPSPLLGSRSGVTTNGNLDGQREHWQVTFQVNPKMNGTDPSKAGAYAAEFFRQQHIREVVELGSGQGRDIDAHEGRGRDRPSASPRPDGAGRPGLHRTGGMGASSMGG